ncbi:hypothetical protein ACYX8G_01465 [Microbacterium saperdae]
MPTPPHTPMKSSNTAPSLGDPAYSLLSFVDGHLLQVGTQATAYISSFALAPRRVTGQAAAA